MTRTHAARRPAFTLIELLVVIAIIAILAAITSGVFGRVRAAQTRSATDTTLTKINARLERRVKAVNDQVADDVKNNHPGYRAVLDPPFGVQNTDLAKAIWTHAKMKSDLPMSLTEAKNPVAININGSVVWNIPVKAVFNALPAEPNAFDESASCLFTAVNANAGGGTVADNDGLEQQVGTTGGGAKCFKDAWGTPIVFVRTAYNPEVANPPFIRTGQPFDPFDPRSKLVPATGGWTAASLATWWNTQRAGAPAFAQVPAAYPGAVNHVNTAISAGSNKNFGTDIYGQPPAPDTDPGKDNHVSYRLRREGNRGD